MTDRYTYEQIDAMCEYQTALQKLEQLEEELMLYDYSDPMRYEIDRQITQTEAWIEDLLATVKR